jgi:ABC-type Fe3+-hydroxamate transport system substrate-binding protein
MIITDQLNRRVTITDSPQRIISLVPSITELLGYLNLDDRIKGITKFCVYPERLFRSKTRVGGTKKINHSAIESINPDLIIANREENLKADVEALAKKFPVWISDISNLEQALEMIGAIGEMTRKTSLTNELIRSIKTQFKDLHIHKTFKTLYLIWKNPYMAAGNDTFIHDMMQRCGFENALAETPRYPEISVSEMEAVKPELVLLSSEPYPFKEKHVAELSILLPDSKVITVDGTYFSWYGSRMLDAPAYFSRLINSIKMA